MRLRYLSRLRRLLSPQPPQHRFAYWLDIAVHPEPTVREECGGLISISLVAVVGRALRDSSPERVIRLSSNIGGQASFPIASRLSQVLTSSTYSFRRPLDRVTRFLRLSI